MRKIDKGFTYSLLSLALVVTGIALVFSANLSQYNNPPARKGEIEVSTNTAEEEAYSLNSTSLDYISRSGEIYSFCRNSTCWYFDSKEEKMLDDEKNSANNEIDFEEYDPLDLAPEHNKLSLNFFEKEVYLCSDEFCWRINEGINNLSYTDSFSNPTGEGSEVFHELSVTNSSS